ncbi:MAG: hypothetical protein OEW30_19520 [Acidimicrobiia bacterium]|nr:hypothetical protein [Acidimicrobiia bacterium]MDH4363305.1 hypothetical protein [Acidimicrobiia bacterium]MDH5294728.1 hypothetical protein [Acidimicrobiia bacterium]
MPHLILADLRLAAICDESSSTTVSTTSGATFSEDVSATKDLAKSESIGSVKPMTTEFTNWRAPSVQRLVGEGLENQACDPRRMIKRGPPCDQV